MRISGLSTIDFRAGFSRKPTLDFKKTFSRPVKGQWEGQTRTPHLLSVFGFSFWQLWDTRLCGICYLFFPGIPTHILLNTTGLSPPARADKLELVSVSGEVIKTLPILYYPDRQPYSLWNITEFVPPNEAFFLRVTGYDLDSFLFQRVSSVSFSSIVPGQWWRVLDDNVREYVVI